MNKEEEKTLLNTLRDLVFQTENNEGTAHPVWFIIDPPGGMVHPRQLPFCFIGPFFSRESAEKQMMSNKHNLGKNPYVWCDSGYHCPDYRKLLDLLKQEAAK